MLPVWNLFWLSPYGLLWTLATLLHRLPGRRCCGLLSSNAYVAHFEQVCVRHSASVPVEKKNCIIFLVITSTWFTTHEQVVKQRHASFLMHMFAIELTCSRPRHMTTPTAFQRTHTAQEVRSLVHCWWFLPGTVPAKE